MGKVGHYEWSILNTGYPQFTHTAKEGERGVSLVSRVVNETFQIPSDYVVKS
jgi:hypothetical protein